VLRGQPANVAFLDEGPECGGHREVQVRDSLIPS
jgi:hypothetical protein